jgi:hypothetical protein
LANAEVYNNLHEEVHQLHNQLHPYVPPGVAEMDLDEHEDPEEPEAPAEDDDGDHGDVSNLDNDPMSRLVVVAQATRVSFVMTFCLVGLSGMY